MSVYPSVERGAFMVLLPIPKGTTVKPALAMSATRNRHPRSALWRNSCFIFAMGRKVRSPQCAKWLSARNCVRRAGLWLRQIQSALKRALFTVDFLLQLQDGIEQRFGARRAAGHIDVHGNYL